MVLIKYEKIPITLKERRVLRSYYGSQDFLDRLESFRKKRSRYLGGLILLIPLGLLGGSVSLALGFSIILYLLKKEILKMEREIKKRRSNFLREYPYFLNYLKLNLGAGKSINNTLESYYRGREVGYYLEKLQGYFTRISLGEDKEKVLLEASLSILEKDVLKIMRFYSYYVQFGNIGLDYLESLSKESFVLKKESVKKKGEEASAKMVFPMMLIFLGITLLVLGPSIFVLKGG